MLAQSGLALLAFAALGLLARRRRPSARRDELNADRAVAETQLAADRGERRATTRLFVSHPDPSKPFSIYYPELATPSAPVPQWAVRASGGVVGYVSAPRGDTEGAPDFGDQRARIEAECERRGLPLVELVCDLHGAKQPSLERPGLAYALERLRVGEGHALMVSELVSLGRSPPDLSALLAWLEKKEMRLVTLEPELDTASESGRAAVRVLGAVGRWERRRLQDRTRKGLVAARKRGGTVSRAAVKDVPELRERIIAMRAGGMTLQAIADRLNADRVPTVRGGAKWRPSSVQSTVGLGRRRSNGRVLG